jgi:hypothetical protein
LGEVKNMADTEKSRPEERILLVLMPFWTSLIPPMGIACLKSFLQDHGFRVRAVNANEDLELRQIYDRYFDRLHDYVPENRRGNFYNIGNTVLQHHLTAGLPHGEKTGYIDLVRDLVFKTFYVNITDRQVLELNRIVADFFRQLERYFLELLAEEKPTILGVSVYSHTLAASMFAFQLTRQNYPGIKTVMGGGVFSELLAPGSSNLESFLEKTGDYIDKIIIGEGENLFLKWLQCKLPESRRVYRLEDIDGKILDISAAGVPDFSDFDLRHYPNLAAYGSRSCPFQCRFCSETLQWGGRYRKKAAVQIVEELAELQRRHGGRLFLMSDSLLNPLAQELAAELEKRGLSIYWDGYLRADRPVGELDNTFLWRRGGFYRARLGLESGSGRVLDLMGKKITVQQIKAAVSSLACAGIKTTTYWVIGYPGEREEDFRCTLELIETLKDDIYEADCNPFNYYSTGQVNSVDWEQTYGSVPLYPQEAREMLVIQTRQLNCEPSREETYRRLNQFVQHCRQLGIPNPYSLQEIVEADRRWARLHKHAVPPLMDLRSGDSCVREEGLPGRWVSAENLYRDDGEWGF